MTKSIGRAAAQEDAMPHNRTQRRRLLDWLVVVLDRCGQRRDLASLTDHQLRDLGLTRRDVADETSRPFWRA